MIKLSVKRLIIILAFAFTSLLLLSHSRAEEGNEKLVALTRQIIETSADMDLYTPFEELKNLYLKDHKYQELVDLLKSLADKKNKLAPFTDYYTALARFHQLKYLEETQSWDEYFSKGNDYRRELNDGAQKVIDSIAPTDPLSIYAKLLLFKFHRGQQDASGDSSQQDLLDAITKYPASAVYLLPLKDIADTLSSFEEKAGAKEIYKIYVDNIVASLKNDDEIKNIALGFYGEKNLELAESVYDVYIERISSSYPKEKLIPSLIEIAKIFSYQDNQVRDPYYTEKIFKKIEEIGTKDVFDEELIYLRAFNIEKTKEYPAAADIYSDLASRFAQGVHADEADFKIGIIQTYILRNIEKGKSHFTKLAQKETSSPQAISSLYQLGLLAQWEQDYPKAKEYYNNLLNKAGGNFIETEDLARQRLKEIEESKPIEYNLKAFLDLSFKVENAQFDTSKVSLNSSLYQPEKGVGIRTSVTTFGVATTGSMPSEVEYLWSGDLGMEKPASGQPQLDVVYKQSGTKVINLVAVTSAGFIDRGIDIIDVY